MSLKLAARLVVFPPYKIADLQENDTVAHDLDVSPFVPPGCMTVLIKPARVSGTGTFKTWPMSDTTISVIMKTGEGIYILPIKDRIISWQNSAANDEWDIYLFGYFVQKRTR